MNFRQPSDGRCPVSLALRHIHLTLHSRPRATSPLSGPSPGAKTFVHSEESPLSRSSESHAGLPKPPQYAARTAIPAQDGRGQGPGRGTASTGGAARPTGLDAFNTWSRADAEAALLECCGSRRWAWRLAAHRPYPDLGALLAASDEAGYDLTPADIAEALAGESAPCLHDDAPRSAHLALRAAHAAYESRFGHVFVICLDGMPSCRHVDQVLAAIRTRLAHDPDEERALAAEEMRRLARGRITGLVADEDPAHSGFRQGGAGTR